ncbi:ABC transporter permease [Streptomyces sp. RGM 3693]|uniref:ABC transporter permease n=1 Tax=Streptomyces sp. RGM 3693 TaxID=3413284 RepID=UPI003D2C2FFB
MRSGVSRYALRRSFAALAVVWGSVTVAFVALHLIDGSPVDVVVGPMVSATPGLRQQIVHAYGFDQPLVVQYGVWLGKLLTGDLGYSYQLNEPVPRVLADQVGPTCQLALAAVGVAVVVALATALLAAGRGRVIRALVSAGEMIAVSVPQFWFGLLALSVVSFRWRLLPIAGDQGVASLVLPAVTLAVPVAGTLSQVLRAGMAEALAQPFALTVRARGVREPVLLVRHALRHASLPALNLAGWLAGSLLSGAVLVETVFARPGVGRVLITAVTSKDTPVVMAVVMLSATTFTVINLLVDLAVPLLDPRLRDGRAMRGARA